MRSEKNKTLLYLSEPGLDKNWMGQYQTAKAWMCFQGLLSKIVGSSSQFLELQTGGRLKEVLHVVLKTRTIRRWELNICDKYVNLVTEDFFVGRRQSKICTM